MQKEDEVIQLCKHGCCPRIRLYGRNFDYAVAIEDDDGNRVVLTRKEFNELKYLAKTDRI
jgi:hypothetical protein